MLICLELFPDISFGLPGLLQTAFELKIDLPIATNQPHAIALTENAINWLKRTKTSKYCFVFKFSRKLKIIFSPIVYIHPLEGLFIYRCIYLVLHVYL